LARELCSGSEGALIADWRVAWTKVELAERYGVSRKSVYKWVGRFETEGQVGW